MPNHDYYCACGAALRADHECHWTKRSKAIIEQLFPAPLASDPVAPVAFPWARKAYDRG